MRPFFDMNLFDLLFSWLASLWHFLASPFHSHPCVQCPCTGYTDEAFFSWMKSRSAYHTYADEMLDAAVIGKPLHCSLCKHPRQSHGSLKKRLLTCDAMPDGGVVYNKHLARLRLQRRTNRFATSAVPTAAANTPQVTIQDVSVGDGQHLISGSVVLCHYDAYLANSMQLFETSRTNNHPFQFTMGKAAVVPGWEKGLAGAKVGGKRTLTIPPELAFGSKSINGVTNATVVFDIEIIAVLSS